MTIAIGFDWGPRGADALELVRMVRHGLSPLQALTAATAGGAEALGLGDQVGTIEPGKLADMVVIDGDPLRRPELLMDADRIWLVLQLGEAVAGAAMERDFREYALGMVDPLTDPHAPEPQGRCVCGEKVTIADAREVTLPNGRPGWQGFCPECHAPLFVIRRRPRASS